MYKDKALQKEATKARVRRYREKQKGVTEPQGVTRVEAEGVTPVFLGAGGTNPPTLESLGVPEEARILPMSTISSVLAVLHNRAVKGLSDDAEGRWERAVTYYDWDKRGRPVEG